MDCSAPDDARDFEQAFRDHVDFAWRVLQRHGVQGSDLEDTCQEVFLTLHRTLPSFEGRSSLRTFIYAICRRVASNHRRLAVHRHEVATGHAAEPDPARPELPTPAGDGEAFELLATKQSLALIQEEFYSPSDVFGLDTDAQDRVYLATHEGPRSARRLRIDRISTDFLTRERYIPDLEDLDSRLDTLSGLQVTPGGDVYVLIATAARVGGVMGPLAWTGYEAQRIQLARLQLSAP
jgi:RNA polymerase sigma factor (sigma-70 family)